MVRHKMFLLSSLFKVFYLLNNGMFIYLYICVYTTMDEKLLTD